MRIAEVTAFFLYVLVPFIAGFRLPFDFRRSAEIELEDSEMKSKYWNNGQSYDEILQNRFTSYVERALSRKRMQFYTRYMMQQIHEVPLEEADTSEELASAEEMISDDFYPEMFENIKLLKALKMISPEDMMIIKLHVLYGLSYESIANSMGVSWSAVSSRCNRAIHKIRKYMEEDKK